MTNQSSPPRQVRCPTCGQPTLFSPENPTRPFCSERCRLIDLGQWASEAYRVPSQSSEIPVDEEDELISHLERSDIQHN